MGAARRDPRRGEIPVTCASTVRQLPPRAREVVSNRASSNQLEMTARVALHPAILEIKSD